MRTVDLQNLTLEERLKFGKKVKKKGPFEKLKSKRLKVNLDLILRFILSARHFQEYHIISKTEGLTNRGAL